MAGRIAAHLMAAAGPRRDGEAVSIAGGVVTGSGKGTSRPAGELTGVRRELVAFIEWVRTLRTRLRPASWMFHLPDRIGR